MGKLFHLCKFSVLKFWRQFLENLELTSSYANDVAVGKFVLACLLPLVIGAGYGGGVSGADGIVVTGFGSLTPPSGSFGLPAAPVRQVPDGVVVTGYGTLLGGADPFSGIKSGFSGPVMFPLSGMASGFPGLGNDGRFGWDSGFNGLNVGPSGLVGPQFGFIGPESGFSGGFSGPSPGGFGLNSGLNSAFPGHPGPASGFPRLDSAFIGMNGPFTGQNSGFGPMNSASFGPAPTFAGFRNPPMFAPLVPVPNPGIAAPFGVRSPFSSVDSASSRVPDSSTVNYLGRGRVWVEEPPHNGQLKTADCNATKRPNNPTVHLIYL